MEESAFRLRTAWIAGIVRRHQLTVFIALSFAWSWGLFVGVISPLEWVGTRRAQVLFAWGPLIAATAVTKLSGHDVRRWVAQVTRIDVRPRWFLIALGLPLVLTDGSRVLVWLAGAPVTIADITIRGFLSQFVVTLLVAGALEEFGWRGFIQPRLQERWSALSGALVVGFVWALWHFPLAYRGAGAGYDAGAFVGLLIGLPLFSITMAWVYNGTEGGLLFVMLFHAMINAPSPLRIGENAPTWAQTVGELGQLGILLLVPLVLVWYHGRSYLAHSSPEPPIPGMSP